MKRILTLLLVLALAVAALASCDAVKNLFPSEEVECTEHVDADANLVCDNCGAELEAPAPEVDEGLQGAYDYLHQMYKGLKNTAANYDLVNSVPVGGENYAVTWSVDVESVTVTEKEDKSGYTVTVPVLEFGDPAVSYKLTFVVTNAEGETLTKTYDLVVPEFKVMTAEEYYAAEKGDALVIQGIVTGIMSKGAGDAENSIYLQDLKNEGGYYVYALKDDPAATLQVGMTVLVKGDKDIYNGTHEVKNASVEIVDSTIKTVEPIDYTEIFTNAANTSAEELVGVQGMLVTIKGVTVLDVNESKGYYNWTLAGKDSYVRISGSSNCTTAAQEATMKANFAANFYNKADVTGIVTVYNNAFYLSPITENAFANFVEQAKPDDVKVSVEKENLKVSSPIIVAGDVTLPTAGANFTDVAISWALAETTNASLAGNVLTPVLPTSGEVTITLTATLTKGEITDTKNFTVVIKALAPISIPEANEIAAGQSHNTYTAEKYIVEGVIVEYGKNGETYGNVWIEDEAGNRLYVYGIYSADGVTKYSDMAEKPGIGDTVRLLGVLGTYNPDQQMKSGWLLDWSKGEGGSGDDNTDTPSTSLGVVDAPIADTAYKFGMVQGNLNNTIYYLAGGMGGYNNYYLATTTDASAAIDVYLEETTGGYYLYTLDGESKLYINMVVSGTHVNGAYEATASTIYTYNTESKTVIAVVNDTNYWFGTDGSKTYDTVGPVKVEYAGFYCQFYAEGEGSDDNTGDDNTGSEETHTCVDEDDNYKCDVEGCNKLILPEDGSTLTIEQAKAIGVLTTTTQKYYVTGTITGFYGNGGTTYGNVYIQDADGNSILVYGLLKNGVQYGNMTEKPVKYDTIKVYGVLTSYNGSAQFKDAELIEYTTHTCSDYTEATCQALAKCVVCGETTGELADHNMVDGKCSVCGHEEGAVEKTPVTVSKTNTEIAGIAGVTVGQNTGVIKDKEIALNEDITIVCAKGGSTSDPCIYTESIRLYQNGATITIKAAAGCEMTTIVLNIANDSGDGPIEVTGGTADNASAPTSNKYTITVNPGTTEVVVKCVGTDKYSRLYISNIEVNYKK